MDTPTEKNVNPVEGKKPASLASARAAIESDKPRRTSRGGVVACDADGEDLHDDDENKNGRD